jgi:type II secretory pathway component HofQ
MPRSLLTLLALLAFSLPAAADEWTSALRTEFVDRKPKDALVKYEAVRTAGHAKAEAATWRRMQIFARYRKKDLLVKECEAFAKAFPKSKALERVAKIKAKPEKYISRFAAGIVKKLKTQKVTLNFNGTPLSDVVGFLGDITGLSFVLLPDADPTLSVSLSMKNITLKNALKLALAADGDLEWKAFNGVVLIGKDLRSVRRHKWTKVEIKAQPDHVFAIATRRVTLNFNGTPLSEVVQFLGDISGIKFRLDKSAKDADPAISVRLRNVTLESALGVMLGPNGLGFYVDQLGARIRANP